MSDNFQVLEEKYKKENVLPCIQRDIRGKDNNELYHINIYKTNKSIIFTVNKINGFLEYKKEFFLEQLIEINEYFEYSKTIDNIYKFFANFNDFKEKDISVLENEYKIGIKYKFKLSKQ